MIPEHYARDLVERCETLIESLLPVVMDNPSARFGGPLGTTFLLAMSTPMVLLPMERMLKPAANRDSVADDRTVDESLGNAVTQTLSPNARFGDAPFTQPGVWSYVAGYSRFNLTRGMPRELLQRLADEDSSRTAMDTSTIRVLTDLRNALAHGGIAYLDERGQQTDGQAAMFAFVGARIDRGGRIIGVNVLRIAEHDYRVFLAKWAAWLRESGVAGALNERAA